MVLIKKFIVPLCSILFRSLRLPFRSRHFDRTYTHALQVERKLQTEVRNGTETINIKEYKMKLFSDEIFPTTKTKKILNGLP